MARTSLLATAAIHSDMLLGSKPVKTLRFSIHYQINFKFLSWTLQTLHSPVPISLSPENAHEPDCLKNI